MQAAHCVVIGAGLAGAAVANRLAQRGWQVLVLDAAGQPAQGASALPAGLLAPQVSPDDGVQSQISRCGVRATLRQASQLLQQGIDWQHTGVLEHRVNGQTGLPGPWSAAPAPAPPLALARASREWTQAATAAQLEAAHLPAQTAALWHQPAAWIKPAALVKALLQHPNIRFEGDRRADALQRTDSQWGVVDAHGQCMALAPLVIITAAHGSPSLLAGVPGAAVPALQALRGQVSWGRRQRAIGYGAQAEQSSLPPFPVNGLGSLIPAVPDGADLRWALGASYERDEDEVTTSALQRAGRHRENLQRLRGLLPEAARVLASQLAGSPEGSSGGAASNGVEPGLDLDSEQAEAFVGIRCASRDRLPLVGPVYATHTGQGRAQTVASQPTALDALQPVALDGLWLCTAMGSRGLTLAVLCADLLAARLHGEPWPLERRLGLALDTAR
jgi:tRNA 5-methylaminomethyl-2-thiouridine biosynthesis bifunctional protein